MSDIIEEARRIVASARHYETIGGKFDSDDLENTAAIIDRLAAELEKAREAIEQLNAIESAARHWLVCHDENVHLLHQCVLSPTEVKQAVHDAIQGVRKSLAAKEPK